MELEDQFPTTHWTLLHEARAGGPEGKRALAELLNRYLPALGAFFRYTRRVPPSEVDDMLQEFVTEKLLDSDFLSHARPERGRFRALLLTSARNFLISHVRRGYAQRRDVRREVTFDNVSPVVDGATPDPSRVFETEWARAVVAGAVIRFQADCERLGRPELWGVFEGRLLGPSTGQPPVAYETLVAQYNLTSPVQGANLLTTAKRMYVRALRAVVAEYEPDEARTDAEIEELKSILAEARLPPPDEAA